MKTTKISYAMQRPVPQTPGQPRFANDKVEVTVELEGDDKPEDAIAAARTLCTRALAEADEAELQRKLQAAMATSAGRAALHRHLDNT